MSQNSDEVIQDRAVRLFTYLKELARLKSKITRDLSAYNEVIWFHEVPEYKNCFSILSSEAVEVQDDIWLEIRKPKEPIKPIVPSSCLRWMDDGMETDALLEPHLNDQIQVSDDSIHDSNGDMREERTLFTNQTLELVDHPEVIREWQSFIQDKWRPWSEIHRAWKAANDIYFRLFSIYEQQKKLGEQYELLLGLGLLTWETPNNQIIKRHIIVGDAYLTFDANRANFVLQRAPDGLKLRLETEMIEQNDLPTLDQQKEIEELLISIQESPWNKDEMDSVLRSWIQSMSPDGSYTDSMVPPEKPTNKPTVTFAPAIILRKRTQRSQEQCFAKIAEQISEAGTVTSGIRLLCEVSEDYQGLDDDYRSRDDREFVREALYLPLPVNEEQIQIVHQTKDRRGILVQGPPGTGKSHTIANLICHLLAHGKRVLVTSQTPRALRVLKNKIPEEIAALCVTLLGNDQASRQELHGSVQSIIQRYHNWDRVSSKKLIISLEDHIYKVQKSIANTNRLLREQREIDTYQHQVADGAYTGTAQQIATRISEDGSKYSWISDDIKESEACPLSNSEFMEFVRLYRELSVEYCSELAKEVVSREDIPNAANFIRMIDNEKAARRKIEEHSSRKNSSRFRLLKECSEDKTAELHNSLSNLISAARSVTRRFDWIEQAISDMLCENDTPWKELRDFLKNHLAGLRENAGISQTLDVNFPSSLNRKKLLADARDLLDHIQTGGRSGWKFIAPKLVKQTRYITKEVSINGRLCSTEDILILLITYLNSLDEIDQLWSMFEGRDIREEGSLPVQVGYLEERLEALETIIELEGFLNAAKAAVRNIDGLAEPQWHIKEETEEMLLDIDAAESEHSLKRVISEIEDYSQKVRVIRTSSKSHKLNNEVLTALEERDAEALARCLDKLGELQRDRKQLVRRDELQEQLNRSAPEIARQIRSSYADDIWNQRVGDFVAAWSWHRADNWLTKFNMEHDTAKLEEELRKLADNERRTIAKLSAEKAWAHCLENLTEHQRTNLIAWEEAIRRIGKGTGKYAPHWRRVAQEYMDECKDAIPAWIMPLYRVFETVNPEPEAYDVVIVDEASQTGPEGLFIQYLAKQCIVVGDDKQISPEAVGVDQNAVNTLIERYIKDVPFKDLYDLQHSLFDHADRRFGGRIVLREHFRCMPEIIQFSNDLCYKSTPLKPLRQYPPKRLEPVMTRYVTGGFREGPTGRVINRLEADELVNTVVEFCSKEEYRGKTFGVISLQGEDQAKYIESKLVKIITPTELEERRMVCGDAYAFQGDERDIIFLSMVAAEDGRRIQSLGKESDQRRFNVAASRAKDQVILFHTATLNDLHPNCMRHKLLKYYLNPKRQTQEINHKLCESKFELDVCQAIENKGYEVIPQYHVAGYYIDLVVGGTRNQLAVECDGDEWHGIEEYESDVARQRILERCGWRFWRVRGCEYYRDPEGSLETLWTTLSKMGIRPIGDVGLEDEDQLEEPPYENTYEDIEYTHQPGNRLDLSAIAAIEEEEKPALKMPESADANGQLPLMGRPILTSKENDSPKTSISREKRQSTDKKQHHSKPVGPDSAIYNYDSNFFFSLSHWAREKELLQSWERSLLFSIGRCLIRGWQISDRQEYHALRIIQEAIKAGFSEEVARQITAERKKAK